MKSHEMGGTTAGKAQDWELRQPAFMPRLSILLSRSEKPKYSDMDIDLRS